jgi:hypothetical protein
LFAALLRASTGEMIFFFTRSCRSGRRSSWRRHLYTSSMNVRLTPFSAAQRANLADFAQFFCTSLVAAARV